MGVSFERGVRFWHERAPRSSESGGTGDIALSLERGAWFFRFGVLVRAWRVVRETLSGGAGGTGDMELPFENCVGLRCGRAPLSSESAGMGDIWLSLERGVRKLKNKV